MLPITYSAHPQGAPLAGRRLRLAAVQREINYYGVPVRRDIEHDLNLIEELRRRENVDAVFYAEASHGCSPKAVEAFKNQSGQLGVLIGYSENRITDDENSYTVVGPDGLLFKRQKRRDTAPVSGGFLPDFSLAGVRVRVEICGNIGLGGYLIHRSSGPSDIDLLINPCFAIGTTITTVHLPMIAGYQPKAALAINDSVRYIYGWKEGSSAFAIFERGEIVGGTSLTTKPGILIADLVY